MKSVSNNSNVIYTIKVGETYSRMTLPLIQDYSAEYEIDLIVADNSWMREYHPSPHWIKMDIFKHFLAGNHARMLYLDLDVFINKKTPNIFDVYPQGSYMTLNDAHKLRNFEGDYFGITHYYNTGVILAERSDLEEILKHETRPYKNEHCYEQTPFNKMVEKSKAMIHNLPSKWNASYHDLLSNSCSLRQQYFIHFSGRF